MLDTFNYDRLYIPINYDTLTDHVTISGEWERLGGSGKSILEVSTPSKAGANIVSRSAGNIFHVVMNNYASLSIFFEIRTASIYLFSSTNDYMWKTYQECGSGYSDDCLEEQCEVWPTCISNHDAHEKTYVERQQFEDNGHE